jgi:hypothetical protein
MQILAESPPKPLWMNSGSAAHRDRLRDDPATQTAENLRADEADFKLRIAAMDQFLKPGGCLHRLQEHFKLSDLASEPASTFLSSKTVGAAFFEEIRSGFPWQGCKFVSMVLLYLVSNTDVRSKLNAVKPVSRSLEGCI